ncbi:MAG: XisI protein [Chloroflexaceae bacterium]|jgi:hypothetical protein|nr:XisI protein [Chloroflexaceae bacterium]
MDRLNHYRQLIEQTLRSYAQIPYAYGDIESKVVIDHENDQYLLVNVGWDNMRRVHGCLVHIDLIDGKVWIQRDGTETGIARELVAAGIPKEQIVLAFHPAERRQYTGYAVA